MAIINVAFGYVGGEGGPDNHPPLFRKSVAQTFSSALSSSQTAAVAIGVSRGVGSVAARIYTDTSIWYEVGRDPVAAADTSCYLPAGGIEFLYVTKGDKIAVLEA